MPLDSILYFFLLYLMISKNKDINATIKFKFFNGTFVANKEVSGSLGQRRVIPDDYFFILTKKLSFFPLKEGILFTVFFLYINNNNYFLRIKLPSCSTLIKRSLGVSNNYMKPNFFILLEDIGLFNPYVITPYMLFEIVFYKYKILNNKTIALSSYFKSHLYSLKSSSIYIFLC